MSDASSTEVVSPDGVTGPATDSEPTSEELSAEIESPAKIIRIGAMVKQLLEEVRNTTMDDAARERMRTIYDNTITEIRDALSAELGEELDRLTLDFAEGTVPSDAELRVAQAQLVGWLEGLFHGIQATLMAQQMAARQQLEGMRNQLPSGPGAQTPGPGYI